MNVLVETCCPRSVLSGFFHGDMPVILCNLFVLVHADTLHVCAWTFNTTYCLSWFIMGCTYNAEIQEKREINIAIEPCMGKIQRSYLKNVMYPHLAH